MLSLLSIKFQLKSSLPFSAHWTTEIQKWGAKVCNAARTPTLYLVLKIELIGPQASLTPLALSGGGTNKVQSEMGNCHGPRAIQKRMGNGRIWIYDWN